MNAGTRTRRLALLALACAGATVVCARTFFVVRILFIMAVGAILERAVALAVIVFMRGVFAVAAFFALASASTTVVSARAFFVVRILRIVGLVAITIIGESAFFVSGPQTALAPANATGAALAIGIGRRNVVDEVANVAAANPFNKVANSAIVMIVNIEIT